VLFFGSAVNLARAVWALAQAEALADVSQSIAMPMQLLFGTSLIWGLVFGVCGLGLWRLSAWARVATLAAVTVFHGHIWFNHIVFDRSDYARQVWPFSLVHTLLILGVVWFFLNWPSNRQLYDKGHKLAHTGEAE
jgi:hypothetical protein